MKLDLWLVRHGETDWTAAGKFCGWSDPSLSERGRVQARNVGKLLSGRRFDSFVSSSSTRAVETAQLAYRDPAIDVRLRELDFGDLEGRTWAECSVEVQESLRDFDMFQAPNGESVAQLSVRVRKALGELGSGRHLVVTHGGVIRTLLGHVGVTRYPEPGSISHIVLNA
ncbi:MAG: histidine phosphatase family protein [Actinomycetota bacterium]